MAENAKATPRTVSAHMLYENVNPFILYEPGGYLDVTDASYIAETDAKVKVRNSNWVVDQNYKVKIEGAFLVGYQNIIITLLRDKHYVQNAEKWATDVRLKCSELIPKLHSQYRQADQIYSKVFFELFFHYSHQETSQSLFQ